jgi:hypothetical protein
LPRGVKVECIAQSYQHDAGKPPVASGSSWPNSDICLRLCNGGAVGEDAFITPKFEPFHHSLHRPKHAAIGKHERDVDLGMGVIVVTSPSPTRVTTQDFPNVASDAEKARPKILR